MPKAVRTFSSDSAKDRPPKGGKAAAPKAGGTASGSTANGAGVPFCSLPDGTPGGRADVLEQEYRARVLRDIAERVREDGPHTARPHTNRARQFAPFAALKGYREMAREREFVPEARHDMTRERALALSEVVSHLRKGDVVRVVRYKDGAYQELRGTVAKVDETFRTLTVGSEHVRFEDVFSIECDKRWPARHVRTPYAVE